MNYHWVRVYQREMTMKGKFYTPKSSRNRDSQGKDVAPSHAMNSEYR